MIRTLTAADVDEAVELSSAAGWNQTAGDWRMLLELAPEGCFGIDCEGRLAATATLVAYGRTLAWLGMVLTWPALRHRGFARMLVPHALSCADAAGIETVKLDATDQGQPIYEGYGFRTEQPIERWEGAGARPQGPMPEDAVLKSEDIDPEAFGADRLRLITLLAPRGDLYGNGGGYLLTRPGRRAAYLGPCVARTAADAEELIRRGLSVNTGPWYWDLLAENRDAPGIAQKLGFAPVRRLVRMARGPDLRGREEMIYA